MLPHMGWVRSRTKLNIAMMHVQLAGRQRMGFVAAQRHLWGRIPATSWNNSILQSAGTDARGQKHELKRCPNVRQLQIQAGLQNK